MNDIIYADVPKDLMKIKTKFLFNLTKRQLCCFGGGALVGVPLYFLTRDALPRTVSMLLMIGIMTPFFLFALYEKNGPAAGKDRPLFHRGEIPAQQEAPFQNQQSLYVAFC